MYFFGCKILGSIGPPLPPIKFIPEYLPGKKTSVTFHYRYYFAFDNVGKVKDGVGGGGGLGHLSLPPTPKLPLCFSHSFERVHCELLQSKEDIVSSCGP